MTVWFELMKPGEVVKSRSGIRSACFLAKCNEIGRDLVGEEGGVENTSRSRRNW